MPINRIKSAKKAIAIGLDLNGDGVVDRKDVIVAAKLVGAATVGVGATTLASASVGSAIVATGASAIAAKVTAAAGGAAGAFAAITLGATTAPVAILAVGPSFVLLATATVTTAVSAKILAVSAVTGAFIAQAANGVVAGFPVIQSIAISNAVAAQEVILIAGIPMAINAAIAAGLIAIVIVGGYAYYLLTKDRLDQNTDLLCLPT